MSAEAMAMNRPAETRLPGMLLPALITVLMLIAAVLAGDRLRPVLDQPVTALRIDGTLLHLDTTQIAAAVNQAALPRLFEVDLDAVKRRVEALPWVAHARVSRIWPNCIAVRINERVAIARWGKASLIDSESRVFTPSAAELPDGLPQLLAPDGHEAETVANYRGLIAALGDGPFKPAGLMLDERGEWRMTSVTGIELRLGQGDPLTRIGLLGGAIRNTLADQIERVAYIDLRYSNGFSVGWKDGAAASSAGSGKAAAKPGAEDK